MTESQTASTEVQQTGEIQNTNNSGETNTSNLETGKINDDNGNGNGLENLSKDELINIIHDTRSEAKTRRLKQRELETKIDDFVKAQKDTEQKQLENNSQWEEAYNKLKTDTSDYEDLKSFKASYEKECEVEIERLTPTLSKPELEIFELSKSKMTYTEQILFIKKLIENRPTAPVIDNTQSTGRGGQPEPEKIKIPFGNTQSVIGNILESLRQQREQKK